MCLAKAYLAKDDKKELLLEDVTSLKIEGNRVFLRTLFGERKEVEGMIREIDFQSAGIVLESPGGAISR